MDAGDVNRKEEEKNEEDIDSPESFRPNVEWMDVAISSVPSRDVPSPSSNMLAMLSLEEPPFSPENPQKHKPYVSPFFYSLQNLRVNHRNIGKYF